MSTLVENANRIYNAKQSIVSALAIKGQSFSGPIEDVPQAILDIGNPADIQVLIKVNPPNGESYDIPSDMTDVQVILHFKEGINEYTYQILGGIENVSRIINITIPETRSYRCWVEFLGSNAYGYKSTIAAGNISPNQSGIVYELSVYTRFVSEGYDAVGICIPLTNSTPTCKRFRVSYDSSSGEPKLERFGHYQADSTSSTNPTWIDETGLSAGFRNFIKRIYEPSQFSITCDGVEVTNLVRTSYAKVNYASQIGPTTSYTMTCDTPSGFVDKNSLVVTLTRYDGTVVTPVLNSATDSSGTLTMVIYCTDEFEITLDNQTSSVYENSFDNIYPWSEIHTVRVKTEGTNGSVAWHDMVKIPKFYVKYKPSVTRNIVTKYNNGSQDSVSTMICDELSISRYKLDDMYELPPDFKEVIYSAYVDNYIQNNNGDYLLSNGEYYFINESNRYTLSSGVYTQNNSGNYLKIDDTPTYIQITNAARYINAKIPADGATVIETRELPYMLRSCGWTSSNTQNIGNANQSTLRSTIHDSLDRNKEARLVVDAKAMLLNNCVTTIYDDVENTEVTLPQSVNGWNINTMQFLGGIVYPLFMVEFATKDSQSIIVGHATGSDWNRKTNECYPIYAYDSDLRTNNLGICPTGTVGGNVQTSQFVYRYMQDIYGSLWNHTTGIQVYATRYSAEDYSVPTLDNINYMKYDTAECEILSIAREDYDATYSKFTVVGKLPQDYTYVANKNRYVNFSWGGSGIPYSTANYQPSSSYPGSSTYDSETHQVTFIFYFATLATGYEVYVHKYNKRGQFYNNASDPQVLLNRNYKKCGFFGGSGYVYDIGEVPKLDFAGILKKEDYWNIYSRVNSGIFRRRLPDGSWQNNATGQSSNYGDNIWTLGIPSSPGRSAQMFTVGGSVNSGLDDGLFTVYGADGLSDSNGYFGSCLTLSLQSS